MPNHIPDHNDVGSLWRRKKDNLGPYKLLAHDVVIIDDTGEQFSGYYGFRHLSGGSMLVLNRNDFVSQYQMTVDADGKDRT